MAGEDPVPVHAERRGVPAARCLPSPEKPPALDRLEDKRKGDEEEEEDEPHQKGTGDRDPLRGEEEACSKEERDNAADDRDRVVPLRPVRYDQRDEVQEPDRLPERGYGIEQIDAKDGNDREYGNPGIG